MSTTSIATSAPLTARLRAGGTWKPRTLDTLRIADAELRAVLEGRRHLVIDGAMGTMLQATGLAVGERPELLSITHPAQVRAIHEAYVAAGAEVITANTFGANALKLGDAATVAEVFAASIARAREAGARYVAGDIGPTGSLLRPLGTLSFDEAYELFAEQARAAEAAGADLIIIETMTDLAEARAAVLAVKEQTNLPILATMTFEADGRTFLGTTPEAAAVTLDALGADAVGINCSLGPAEIRPFVKRMLSVTSKPIMVQANAGLPRVEQGKTVFDIGPEAYAHAVTAIVEDGASIIGGCCGTTPAYTSLLAELARERTPRVRRIAPALTVASAQRCIALPAHEHRIAVIGERLNPTGKKRLQQALRQENMDYLASQAISQEEQGADILDLNVGLPELDEVRLMERASEQLQASTTLPLQFDATDPVAIEAACRRYPGKPIINSVNGAAESLDAVLPIAAHYGANIIGLTLDDEGIPATAEGRLAIAQRIVDAAETAGIPRERILIDCLVMTASTNQEQVAEILRAVTLVKQQLGVATTLGVSNVSFGLPARAVLNATFLASALGAGLDAPIINPGSARYMDVIRSFRVLNGEDAGSAAFIERYANAPDPYQQAVAAPAAAADAADAAPVQAGDENGIEHLVISGRRGETRRAVEALIGQVDALELIDAHLIPALDEVGRRFDAGTLFLPQLMASAEAAKAGFDVIRAHLGSTAATKGAVCLATVQGDIHDIGKNIVKMLLENYGYRVFDLGRDVAPEAIVACVREHDIRLVGLSALMTTTVPAMADTIEQLRRTAPGVKVMVGGAVLTPDYAREIGADFYAKDAAEATRLTEACFADKPYA